MLLALGSHQIDITHRAVVVGVVRASEALVSDASRAVDEGADAIEIVIPSGVGTNDVELVEKGVRSLCATVAPPVMVRTTDDELRSALAAAGAVTLDVGAELVVSTVELERHLPHDAVAHQVVAIVGGVRVVLTGRVRSTRRVAAVTARLLEARAAA